MLRLAVCDDNRLFLQEMKEALEADERVEEVALYENPEHLMETIGKRQKEFDAVFMDIEFDKEESGIRCVKELFRYAPQMQLIYVTGYHDKYIQQIFLADANPAGYLVKPPDRKLLGQYLDKICKRKETKNVFTFSVRGKKHIIAADRVLYLESNNHRVSIHTEEETYSVYGKISDFQKQLPSSFIQCHKSFLVNMNRIRYMEGNDLCFSDGRRVPVSKIHQERVRKSYFLHLGQTI
ncbi:MAG: LytTR family DNA-binding domain-containing protein [Eubacteriales bacterium]|nr:LytTR family DNA-binding domain-containing protein [Eubacteriales bacterium]